MERFSKQFYKKAEMVTLKKSEQADLRDQIISYMEYHPLPSTSTKKVEDLFATKPVMEQASASQPILSGGFPFIQMFKYGGAFAAIMLFVVPFVAERAVPGDTLYAVKVNFNEEVRSTLTLNPYEKVEWETVRLNRRIAEAKLLKKEGLLTEEAEADVAAAVRQHADSAKAEIETMRELNADDAAIATIELDANLALQAQAFSLEEARDTSSSTFNGSDLIAFALDASLEKDQATTSLPALPKLIARVEQHTTRVRELESTLVGQIDETVQTDVKRRIVDLERLAAEAFALSEEESVSAQELLVSAITRAQTLIVYMTELTVRETIEIAEVVPVVLTDSEKAAAKVITLIEIDEYLSQFAQIASSTEKWDEVIVTTTLEITLSRTELLGIENYHVFSEQSKDVLNFARNQLEIIEQEIAAENITPTASSTAATTEPVLDDSSEQSSTTTVQVETDIITEEEVEVSSSTAEVVLPAGEELVSLDPEDEDSIEE